MPALLLLTLLGLFAIGTIAACRAPGRDRRLGVLLLTGGTAWLALYGVGPVSPEGSAALCAVLTMLTVAALKQLLRRRGTL